MTDGYTIFEDEPLRAEGNGAGNGKRPPVNNGGGHGEEAWPTDFDTGTAKTDPPPPKEPLWKQGLFTAEQLQAMDFPPTESRRPRGRVSTRRARWRCFRCTQTRSNGPSGRVPRGGSEHHPLEGIPKS